MLAYCAGMSNDLPSPGVPGLRHPEHPRTTLSLARQFGSEDEMELTEERSLLEETVDSEFARYNYAALSQPNINILDFWAVGTLTPYK